MKHTCRAVEVTAPSRLHFGLLSFGHSQGRRYGGAGVMVDQPGLQLRIEAAVSFSTEGPLASRVVEFVSRWSKFHRLAAPPSCRITVKRVLRQHAGLGVGTQLGMSVAAGLCCFVGDPVPSMDELAMSVGRAKRSAIGTYGFAMGGLLAERGCLEGEPVAPLDCQLDLPPAWHMVLACPQGEGLSGMDENNAFANQPPVPCPRTEQLKLILRDKMFPAAATGNFGEFSKSIFEYGFLAGECFAASQGGPYNGPLLTRIVAAIREREFEGVGQSSWGPTIFALVENAQDGDVLASELTRQFNLTDDEVWVSAINRDGASIQVVNQSRIAVM